MPLGRVRPLGMRSILVALVGLFVAVSAFALNCTQYRYVFSPAESPWFETKAEACSWQGSAPQAGGYRAVGADMINANQCRVRYCAPSTELTCDYSSGYGAQTLNPQSRTGDYCQPDQCAGRAGEATQVNMTAGWSLSNHNRFDAGFFESQGVGELTAVQYGAAVCMNQCKLTVGDPGQVFQSLERHANGMFRWSADYNANYTGEKCTGQMLDAGLPTTPEPACPGFIGEVNGVRTCVPGSGHAPSNAASAASVLGGAPTTAGNPAAGERPDTGPGSGDGGAGRTPLVGSGGNAGGSSSAASGELPEGTPGDGTPGDPYRPKDPCGLPGTPACKLDERGTPTGEGAYTGAIAALDTASLAERGAITGAGSSVQGLSWAWAWQLPAGACSSIDLSSRFGSGSVDPCSSSAIALLRSLLGYLYFGLAAAYIWRSAISAPKG